MTVTCTLTTSETIARSCPINEYSIDRFGSDAFRILKQYNRSFSSSNNYSPAIISLGICAGKFLDNVNTKSIADMFAKPMTKIERMVSKENTGDWHEEEEDDDEDVNNSDGIISVKPSTTILSNQGDFFRKFQKIDAEIENHPKFETKSATSITSFFFRYATNENIPNSSPNKNDDRYVTCSRCKQAILAWNMPEHKDFHYAYELTMKENQNHSIMSTIVKTAKTTKCKNNKHKLNNQTLDSFLNKKSKI